MCFDIYMKWKLDYRIFVLHVQFAQESLEFQVNHENIHPILTILKVSLALNLEQIYYQIDLVKNLYFFFFMTVVHCNKECLWLQFFTRRTSLESSL